MAANNAELRDCLIRVGWGVNQCDAIIAEGFNTLDDLGEMVLKDISYICTTISKLPNNRGGVRIGYGLIRRLKGLVWWVKDHLRRGLTPDETDWTLATCKDAIDFMDMEEARGEEDNKIEPPGKLKESDWVQWELKLTNFLQNMYGNSGVPLHYVIRKDLPDGHVFANDEERLVHECPLNGLVFDEDNRKVFGVIKQAVADTQNWDWIKRLNRAQDGRGAMTLLRSHFDGPGEVEKRIAHANNAMEQLHYTKESIFPFSSYVTGLNTCYTTLEGAQDPVSERNKVAKMLKGITTQNASLIAAMQNIRSNPNTKSNFTAASNELSEQVALIFPGEARRPSSRGRRVSNVERSRGRGRGHGRGDSGRGRGYGRGRGGRGRGRGGRGSNRPVMADGIDITDVTRSFTDQEWNALTSENRRHVHEERERKRSRTDTREVAATNSTTEDVTTEETPANNNGGAGRAAGFGRGAYPARGRGRGRGPSP